VFCFCSSFGHAATNHFLAAATTKPVVTAKFKSMKRLLAVLVATQEIR
jgi:hypothetical protein